MNVFCFFRPIYKVLFFVSFLLSLHHLSNAQILELKETVYTSIGPGGGQSYRRFQFREKGETSWQRIGVFGGSVRPYLEGNDLSMKHLKDYQKKNIVVASLALGAIGSFTTFAVKNMQNKDLDSGVQHLGYAAAAVGMSLAGYLVRYSSYQNIRRAFSSYNSEQNKAKVSDIDMGLVNQRLGGTRQNILGIGFTLNF